ncbi:MAG: hypothetical protein M3P48_00320 [Actinomycetota bacterium]|nr:hypothetical protein [Actinomycetota bacterium]
MDDSPDRHDEGALRAVRAVSALVTLQGAALVAAAGAVTVELFVATADSRTSAVALAVTVLVLGAGVVAVGRALGGRRAWARSPTLVVQIFAALSGWSFVQGPRWYVGVVLLGWAIAVTVLLFSAPVGRALDDAPGPG